MSRYELVELDPDSGAEITVLSEGTKAQMIRHLAEVLEDEDSDEEDGVLVQRGAYRVQAAA